MAYLIQYDDGAYNFGPETTAENGFPVQLSEASRYTTYDSAAEKLKDLVGPDGSGAKIVVDPT